MKTSLVTCAKFIHTPGIIVSGDPFDTEGHWCGKEASWCTRCNDKDGFLYFNIGHFYCDEHRPSDAIRLPSNYNEYIASIGHRNPLESFIFQFS